MLLQHGIEIASGFSGHMCSEDSLLFHIAAFIKHTGFESEVPVESRLRVASVADMDHRVRDVLLAREVLQPLRVFGQIESQVRPDIMGKLRQERDEATEAHSSLEELYRTQLDWLLENRSEAFELQTRQMFCFKNCAEVPILSAAQRCRLLAPRVSTDEEERRPVQLHLAGTPCVAYSPRGSRLGLNHETSLVLAIYLAQRVAYAEKGLEDVCFHENSVCFPAEAEVHRVLEKVGTHKCITVRFGCQQEGWPFSRSRTFTCMYNTSTMVWLGPHDSESIDEDFNELFGKQYPVVDGSMFMVSTDAEVEQEQKEQRKRRRRHDAEDAETDADAILTRGQEKRKKRFEEFYVSEVQSPHAAFADINQNPPRSRVGPNITAITCKAQIYSWRHARLATTYETMLCMGLPGSRSGPPVGDCGLYSPNELSYEKMGWRARMQIVGNGQHMSSNGAFMLYCLSQLMATSDMVADVNYELKFCCDDDTGSDDDEEDVA